MDKEKLINSIREKLEQDESIEHVICFVIKPEAITAIGTVEEESIKQFIIDYCEAILLSDMPVGHDGIVNIH